MLFQVCHGNAHGLCTLGFREESTMVVSLVYKQHRGYNLPSFKPLEGKTLHVPCLSLNDDEGNNVPEMAMVFSRL
jgi:hypothetical protein